MKRRTFITTSGSLALGSLVFPNISLGERFRPPNLLFIITDQQRADTMAVFGNNKIRVPNLNNLARESVVFRNTYVSQPVCTPSRSTILTGLYPHTNGCTANNVPLSPRIVCLPEMISDGRYKTAYFGKWHLGDEIFPQHGFQEWAAIDDSYIKYYGDSRNKKERSAYHNWLIQKGYEPDQKNETFSREFVTTLPYEHSKPKFLAAKAIDFLTRNKDNPFILYLGIFEPHSPFNGPFDSMYSHSDIELPLNFGDLLEDNEPLRNRLLRQDFITNGTKGYQLQTEIQWREMISNYWGLISQVDRSVGEILTKLESLGLKKDTIVVFTSDHGDMMGSHQLALKSVMYQEAVRVPFIIRYPRLFNSQRIFENPVSHIDLVPTLISLLNVESATGNALQGHSLLPFIENSRIQQDHVFIEWNPNLLRPISKRLPLSIPSVSAEERDRLADQHIRTVVSPDGWKLCLSDRDLNQLYHLKTDPGETTNLYYNQNYMRIINNLKEKIFAWQDRTADNVELS
jgi:arylsulfatase